MNNVCFEQETFSTFEDGWDFIYNKMNEIYPDDESEQEESLQEYSVQEITERDRIMWTGQRYVFKQDCRG